jgi:hypothetical protein
MPADKSRMETMGRRVSLHMQQYQPPRMAQCHIQHRPRCLHPELADAGIVSAFIVYKEEDSCHAHVWCRFLVSISLFPAATAKANCNN